MNDVEFMAQTVTSICDYAVANDMSPNETIRIVAENLLRLVEISNFVEWKGADDETSD